MSLINQMLKGLEQRSKMPTDPEITLSGLFAPDSARYSYEQKNYKHVIGLLFIVSILFCAFASKSYIFHHKHATQEALASDSVLKNQSTMETSNTSTPSSSQMMASILTGIVLDVSQNVTHMNFSLNQDTHYTVSSNKDQTQLVFLLDHTNLMADLHPVDYLKSAIQGMEMSNNANGDLKIVLTLHAGAEIKRLELTDENNSSVLHLDILYTPKKPKQYSNVASSSGHPTFTINKTEEYNLQQKYQSALNFSHAGENKKAEELLDELLIDNPNFYPARESLIELFLQQGNKLKAKQFLHEGLERQPNYPPLVEIKARLLVSEGKASQALELLEKAAPSIEAYPDYHAFIAALYQQNGQPLLARKLYEQLLKLQPGRAVWWMGLGIALESLESPSEAKEVYMRASHLSGLNPEVNAFLDSRIHSL